MTNSLPHIELGKHVDSRHVKEMMPDARKDPLWDDFNALIEQAVVHQNASRYGDLNEAMKWALAVAALHEHKTLAIEAEFDGFNQVLANVFEKRGSVDSLQKLYQYFVRIVIKGNSRYDGQVAYCIDNALEKEEDKQADYAAEEAQNKGGFYYEDYCFYLDMYLIKRKPLC